MGDREGDPDGGPKGNEKKMERAIAHQAGLNMRRAVTLPSASPLYFSLFFFPNLHFI